LCLYFECTLTVRLLVLWKMTKWKLHNLQFTLLWVVTSTPDVHVGRGAMSVDDASSIVCVPANDIDEAPEMKTQTGDMALYASWRLPILTVPDGF